MRVHSGRPAHRRVLVAAVIGLLLCGGHVPGQVQVPGSFASLIGQLSEPAGYFDTDNLISNEKSYLHVIPALRQAGVRGGAYIGVGPDQNFSYIAEIRPTVAFIVDVRRDNLLLHLLFKALFGLARTRIEYLSLLFGRPIPDRPDEWRDAGVDRLIAHVDRAGAAPPVVDALRRRVDAAIKQLGVPLSPKDLEAIDRFHRAFIDQGLSLKFQSYGRPPRSYYPTYRELLLETDREENRGNYLAAESDFQFVRSLQARDLVIPIVGNLGGSHALAGIGRLLVERGERLSAFYTSNVESYLFRDGSFSRYIENVSRLPRTDRSVIIRAVFSGTWRLTLPESVPGYYSTSLVQPVDELIEGFSAGRYRNQWDLLTNRGSRRTPDGVR